MLIQPIFEQHTVVGGNSFLVKDVTPGFVESFDVDSRILDCDLETMSGRLDLDYNLDTRRLDVDYEFKWPGTRLPYYDGDYVTEASNVNKYLYTKDKSMSNNITILPIQAHWEENEAGGYTVTIGKGD